LREAAQDGDVIHEEFDMSDSSSPGEREEQIQRRFDQVADGYDRPSLRAFRTGAERLVELASLQSGQVVLDVASGTGHAAVAAACAVGPKGQVVAVDASPEMCTLAQQKVTRLGLTNVEVRQGNGAALTLPDMSFDAVLCASGIYTFPDIPAALLEWRRVLKPGGRLAFSSLGAGSDSVYRVLLQRYGISLPKDLPPQRVDSIAKCESLLNAAGFDQIMPHTEQLGYFLPDAEQCWEIVWYTGARMPLSYLPPPVVERFMADYLAAVAASATEQGIWVDWPALFLLARKPSQPVVA
jgi:ubiquinone/menaquinone biosynthesis C-methylase UbiE